MNNTLLIALLLAALRYILRRPSLAILAFIALGVKFDWDLVLDLGIEIGLPISIGTTAIMVLVFFRFGLAALFVAELAIHLGSLASTRDWTGWRAQPAILALVVFVALTVYGYWAATSGHPRIRQREA